MLELYVHFWRLSCQVERALCPAALIRENIHPENEEEKDESRQSEFIKQKQKKLQAASLNLSWNSEKTDRYTSKYLSVT